MWIYLVPSAMVWLVVTMKGHWWYAYECKQIKICIECSPLVYVVHENLSLQNFLLSSAHQTAAILFGASTYIVAYIPFRYIFPALTVCFRKPVFSNRTCLPYGMRGMHLGEGALNGDQPSCDGPIWHHWLHQLCTNPRREKTEQPKVRLNM